MIKDNKIYASTKHTSTLEQQIFKYSRVTSISTAVGPYIEHGIITFGMIQKLWPMFLLYYDL